MRFWPPAFEDTIERVHSIEGTPLWPQAQFDPVLGDIAQQAFLGDGVTSGCAVTAQGSPDMSVAVAAGTVVIGGVEIAAGGGTVAVPAAHASLDRFDLIVIDDNGDEGLVQGDPDVPEAVRFPTYDTATQVVVASVYVLALDSAIVSSRITDARVGVQSPIGAVGWTPLSAAADQSKTNSTLANDDICQFVMAANTKYRIRGILWFESASTTPDLKLRHTGPASPTQVGIYIVIPNAVTGLESGSNRIDNAYSAADISVGLSADLAQPVKFEGFIHNGANSGTFAWQFAQNTTDATATIRRAGSIMEYAVA